MKTTTGTYLNLTLALLFLYSAEANSSDIRAQLFSGTNLKTDLQSAVPASASEKSAASQSVASPSLVSTEKPLSKNGALLRSLLVPGWGESYLGYHGTARAFFWTDVAIWATVIGFETYSKWREDQFLSYGADHAGAHMGGKTDAFYADIGNYMSTDEYNEAKLRNRDYEAVYTDPSYFWAWDSDPNRQAYDHLRIESKSAHNKMYFFIGAAALNRLISIVDTGKKATDLLRQQNKSPQISFHLEPDLLNSSQNVKLVVTADFSP
jgi:hypothetical protein